MKILSDFDGVMTEQSEEADRALAIFEEALQRMLSLSPEAVSSLTARAAAGVNDRPGDYGWLSRKRISAYSDEDLFIRNISYAGWLDAEADRGDADVAALRERLEGYDTFESLCGWAYTEMTRETSAGKLKPMDAVVGETISALLEAGHEIVVVSNSGTERVKELLETVGLKPERHTDAPDAQLRVRGGARKFELAEEPRDFSERSRAFEVSRPKYETILREEKPEVVIGDVFSLDLALPLYMAREASGIVPRDLFLILRRRSYTPDWAVELFDGGSTNDAIRYRIMDRFQDLAQLVGLV